MGKCLHDDSLVCDYCIQWLELLTQPKSDAEWDELHRITKVLVDEENKARQKVFFLEEKHKALVRTMKNGKSN